MATYRPRSGQPRARPTRLCAVRRLPSRCGRLLSVLWLPDTETRGLCLVKSRQRKNNSQKPQKIGENRAALEPQKPRPRIKSRELARSRVHQRASCRGERTGSSNTDSTNTDSTNTDDEQHQHGQHHNRRLLLEMPSSVRPWRQSRRCLLGDLALIWCRDLAWCCLAL